MGVGLARDKRRQRQRSTLIFRLLNAGVKLLHLSRAQVNTLIIRRLSFKNCSKLSNLD